MTADGKPTFLPGQVRQEYQVSVYYRLCKYLPFEVSNKRVKGWEYQRALPDGGKLVMIAHETITPGDVFVLIAGIKVFQDHQDLVLPSTIQSLNKMVELLSITINWKHLRQEYLKHNNLEKLVESLRRLSSFQAVWYLNDGSVINHRYLWDYSLDSGQHNVTLTISKAFAILCFEKGWLLNFNYLQRISSPTGRALFLYFSSNSGLLYKQETLERWLGLMTDGSKKARDNRKQIKRALEELVRVGFLEEYSLSGGKVNIIHRRHKKGTPPPQCVTSTI